MRLNEIGEEGEHKEKRNMGFEGRLSVPTQKINKSLHFMGFFVRIGPPDGGGEGGWWERRTDLYPPPSASVRVFSPSSFSPLIPKSVYGPASVHPSVSPSPDSSGGSVCLLLLLLPTQSPPRFVGGQLIPNRPNFPLGR